MSVRNLIPNATSDKNVMEIPKLTSTQIAALVNPLKGQLVFDTTINDLCYYDGSTFNYVVNLNTFNVSGFYLNASTTCAASVNTVVGNAGGQFTKYVNTGQPNYWTESNGIFTVGAGGYYRVTLHLTNTHSLVVGANISIALQNSAGQGYMTSTLTPGGTSEYPISQSVDMSGIFQFNTGDNVEIVFKNLSPEAFTVIGTFSASGYSTFLNFEKLS
jgi:hypothetical protein